MSRADFNERRERRIEGMRARAEKRRQEGETRLKGVKSEYSLIPLGQPIIGHRDRRRREKLFEREGRAYKHLTEADNLERRASAAENNQAIFSDDPEAIAKLKEKLAEKEAYRDACKAVNKRIRAGEWDALTDEERARVEPYGRHCAWARVTDKHGVERASFPAFVFRNIGQEIRRIQGRIETLKSQQQQTTKKETIGAVEIVQDAEANRTRLFFPGKPPEGIRASLKKHGFRWAPSEGCWQRHLSSWALECARCIAREFANPSDEAQSQ